MIENKKSYSFRIEPSYMKELEKIVEKKKKRKTEIMRDLIIKFVKKNKDNDE